MSTLHATLTDTIRRQFASSAFKNIFFTGDGQLAFSRATKAMISLYRRDVEKLTAAEADALLASCVEGFLEQMYDVNQYVNFFEQDKAELGAIYSDLLSALKDPESDLEALEAHHYHRIASFIARTNPIIFRINGKDDPRAVSFLSAQYSPEFQVGLLGLCLSELAEPVLDIGCGEGANLVRYLRGMGIEATGIDRLCENTDTTYRANWLEYDYGREAFGTVVSNLGFASHCLYHQQAGDGLEARYANVYLDILWSLQLGGSFHYAPSLPALEARLDPRHYEVKVTPVHTHFSRTIVTKLPALKEG